MLHIHTAEPITLAFALEGYTLVVKPLKTVTTLNATATVLQLLPIRLSNNNHKTSCQPPVVHERLAGDHAMPFWSASAVSR